VAYFKVLLQHSPVGTEESTVRSENMAVPRMEVRCFTMLNKSCTGRQLLSHCNWPLHVITGKPQQA
jgi:hypothetical protein